MKQEYSSKSNVEDVFKLYTSKTKSLIETELAKLVLRLSELNLHPQIEYAVLNQKSKAKVSLNSKRGW